MKLTLDSILNHAAEWYSADVTLPKFDIAAVRARTKAEPEWVHFGTGNILRGFISSLNQRMLNEGLANTGIIACSAHDFEVVDRIYVAHDSLTLNVQLNPDGTTTREVLAGIAYGVKGDFGDSKSLACLKETFTAPSLKMLSFTITEKGYSLRNPDGSWLPAVEADLQAGPARARHVMAIVCALLFVRFQAGALPLALVSMDNCSHNGEKLMNSVLAVAEAWKANGFVGDDFLAYLRDESKIAFPLSMLDKITPRPHPMVQTELAMLGIEGMEPIVTAKKTFVAPFVNAEKPQYLVIEDKFPNGRPPLEKVGVYFCDRDTVNRTEKMKVTTCLNPLHTAMAVYGCLLGYMLVSREMEDPDIVNLVKRLGYQEGLPVVVDPKIIAPKDFIDEVVNERLPNPFILDDPHRIATDTSQKVGIRFGETIKSYLKEGRDLNTLVAIPLALAGWLRYLLGVDDRGEAMEVSSDPLKDEIQARLANVIWNDPSSYRGELRELLANVSIFGTDLTQTPLADRVEGYFRELLAGPGSVRRLLQRELSSLNQPFQSNRGTTMRTIVGCLAACAAFSTLQVAAAEAVAYTPEPLVFTTPSENDRGAMMLGDGEVGALAWVSGDGTLHAVLQRSDSWNEVGEHVKVGQIDYVSSRPVDEGTYRQELSMARGAFEATWKSGGKPVSVHYRLQWEGGNFAVCEFVGAPDAVAKSVNWRLYPGGFRKTNAYELGRVINYSSGVMPNKMGVKFKLDISADRLLADLPDGFSGWCHENYKPTVDKLLAEFDRTQATADLGKPDLLHDRVFGTITRTEKATGGKTLFLSAVTCYCPCAGESEWRRRTFDQLAKQGWQSAQEPSRRAAHVAGWRQFWDRSHIVVSPANSGISPAECRAANVAWACQRYLTRCAGTGKLAMRYNGSLFTATEKGNPDYRLWGHGYWWQNVRLLYYPMFVAGDCEMTETLFRMYSYDLLDFHQKRTRRYLNHGGAYFPECMQPWGDHFIGCYGTENFKDRKDNLQHHPCHKYEWLGQLELSQMMIHRYLYTEDADWFKTKALPAIREYVRYFDEHYRLAADGRYDWQPAQACETWWKCVTPMTEVAGLTSITEQLLALPKDLVGADDRALFAKIRARIPALPTRKLKDGRLAYAPAAKFELHRNVEHPELYCVFPFRLCSFEKPNAEYGRNAYEVRSPRHYNGWSQEELFTAYLGMGEETKKNFLHRVTTNSDKHFRWPAFWGPNFDWKPDQCHGGNVQNILQSMILQYDGRKIFLFPAWTKDWNCEFKLHAPYRTTVQGRVENGKVVDLVVTPASRRADLQICGGCQVDAN